MRTRMIEKITDNVDVETDESSESPETTATPEFNIPEEYANSGWAKNIKSEADLWKSMDNAQKLIGRKTIGIPDFDKADESEITAFYEHTRPKEQTAYELGDGFSEAEKETIQKVLYENGINKRQAKNIVAQFKEMVKTNAENTYGEEGLKKVMEQRFGADWQASTSKISEVLGAVITPETLNDMTANMTNEGIGAVYQVAKALMDKFAVKDGDFAVAKNGGNAGMSFQDFYKKMQEADKQYNSNELKKSIMKQYYGGEYA